ncbi:siphovirus ReqiPepy6 Gp37-like family protein [Priestia taiwanensis]|uniref:Gp28/Gp37-like domain-containing protein n=1 Tax=Priestia taiwanensis TaxID=1347902 RepID=A0A917AK67_9BACI|nr:siphovirus ReqiPepy6 Gp37-like family protein [Priestia taiwanensis]MBM7362001.1 hypothetical protein [Priestia taiwanensis]GGE58654.1 hypothetical protein GCM10007140_06260 [Priestia taiwanensis]
MEIFVFDLYFNRLGVIDDFISLKIERNYDKLSELEMSIDANSDAIKLLKAGHILAKSNDLKHGYLIMTDEYQDQKSSQLNIIAPSLNILLNRRLITGQQTYKGNAEDVIYSFINNNAIATSVNRVLPNFYIDNVKRCGLSNDEISISNKYLDDATYQNCKKHDVSFDVIFDIPNKKYHVVVWKGTDRSTQQDINSHVIFSKERENVIRQHYVESISDYKNVAIVAGEGEGLMRKYATVNDNLKGFDRIEAFVDARDLQSKYKNENGDEITLPDAEYTKLLNERGESKLSEYQKITTFESEVDLYANHVFGTDYAMGDIVSVKNDDLGIIMHPRIVSTLETYNKQGKELDIKFGTNIPTLTEKIKRMVK